ncbi:MAG: hypothetical protein QXQ64_01605 [Candidatus Bathyarchaeia archaeon]
MEKEEDEAAEEEEAEAESPVQVVRFLTILCFLLSLLRIRRAYSLLRLAIL